MGWYLALPDADEQVIFNPALSNGGEFVVNTYVPANNSILSCTTTGSSGWTMGIDPETGAESPTPFLNVGGKAVDGMQIGGTGTPAFVNSGQTSDHDAEYLITQTNQNGQSGTQNGTPGAYQVNNNAIVAGQRLNWVQRR